MDKNMEISTLHRMISDGCMCSAQENDLILTSLLEECQNIVKNYKSLESKILQNNIEHVLLINGWVLRLSEFVTHRKNCCQNFKRTIEMFSIKLEMYDTLISLYLLKNKFIDHQVSKVIFALLIRVPDSEGSRVINHVTGALISKILTDGDCCPLSVLIKVIQFKDASIHPLNLDEEILNPQDKCGQLSEMYPTFDTEEIREKFANKIKENWNPLMTKVLFTEPFNTKGYLNFLTLWKGLLNEDFCSPGDNSCFGIDDSIFEKLLNTYKTRIELKEILELLNKFINFHSSTPGKTLPKFLHAFATKILAQMEHLVGLISKEKGIYCFGGLLLPQNEDLKSDRIHVTEDPVLSRRVFLLGLQCLSILSKHDKLDDENLTCLKVSYDNLKEWAVLHCASLQNMDSDEVHWILTLFQEQDDLLFTVLLCNHSIISALGNKYPEYSKEPHTLFCQFLASVGWDHQVLLDFLISEDTVFLVYFLAFLKYYKGLNKKELDRYPISKFLEVLGNLSKSVHKLVSKNLFPYNVKPLLRLIKDVQGN